VTATPKFGSDARWAGTLTVFADITDQKRAEAALQESEEKYRNLVERANDGIVIIQDELIAFANRRFAALAGRSVKAITGIPFLDCIHPDEREKVEGYYRARLAGSTVPATYETSLSRIGGGRLPVEMNAGVITYRGKPADLKIVRDISARKEAEEEIHAKSVRLEFLNRTLDQERVQLLDLTRQLTLANEELKRLSEAKSEFVASVSHDLRTPLTTIISGVAMVEQGTLGRVNAEQRKFLRYALEDAERLADLIGDILDVAKIEAGKITVNPTCVNVEQHVARVRESHAGYAGEKELTLTCRVAGPLPSVRCDAEHYTRILANLLSNAVKYTPPKGTITLSATADADGWVTTSVADTGVGIPLEEQARVFGRFEQIRRDGFFPQPGSGLGLALCKQLVELNGGTIGFTSRENEGSTFYFRLPPCAEDEDKPKC
jgi:PAS domain S-box-containing protein